MSMFCAASTSGAPQHADQFKCTSVLRSLQPATSAPTCTLSCPACRYGDEQHLDEALKRVFLIGRPKGLSKRQCPRLKGLREELVDGNYALALEFESKNKMTAEQWTEREDKFGTFFGPGITAKVRRNHALAHSKSLWPHELAYMTYACTRKRVSVISLCAQGCGACSVRCAGERAGRGRDGRGAAHGRQRRGARRRGEKRRHASARARPAAARAAIGASSSDFVHQTSTTLGGCSGAVAVAARLRGGVWWQWLRDESKACGR